MTVEDLCGNEDGFYVALNAGGEIVEIANLLGDLEQAIAANDSVVSVGFMAFTITDYDETYSLGDGLLTPDEEETR